jgi:hypothetical protein
MEGRERMETPGLAARFGGFRQPVFAGDLSLCRDYPAGASTTIDG